MQSIALSERLAKNDERNDIMPNISCDAVKCIYNCDRGCCRTAITVDGENANSYEDTECASFSDKVNSLTNSSACESSCPCSDCEIECTATECKYNSGNVCTAEGIDVGTCYACNCSETRCETFTNR